MKVWALRGSVWVALLVVAAAAGSALGGTTINVPTQYTTIQAAINAASAGDTIAVAAGTYAETLSISKSLSIVGAGAQLVTINVAGKPGTNSSGIYVTANDVALSGFTLVGTTASASPRYGIKYGEVSGGALSDIVVQQIYRSGIDLLGSTDMAVSNVVSQNNGGHGFSLTDCKNITLSNLTTRGNGWQAVSVATWGCYSSLGTSGIVFTGTLEFTEVFQLEQGKYPSGPPETITFSTNIADGADVTVPAGTFSYALFGDDNEAPSYQRVYFVSSFDQAATAAAYPGTLGHLKTTGRYIQSIVDRTQLYATPGCSVRAAVEAGHDGDVVHVDGSTYTEQVVIDDDLSLVGAGSGTIIEAPNTLSVYFLTGSNKNYPIVYVHDTDNALIQDLVVDGLGKGNANYRFVGIGFYNAGGTVDNVEIRNIENTPFSGSQHGVGIYAYNADGTPRTLIITSCSIHDFQKNAMALLGAGLTVDVSGNNVVVGEGRTASIAQNGIQVGSGAGGRIADNAISGVWYTGTYWGSTGILIIGAEPGIQILRNTVTDCQMGINSDTDRTLVEGNRVTGSEWAVILYGNNSSAVANDIEDSAYGFYADGAEAEIVRNVVRGADWSVLLYGADAELHYNSFSGNANGFYSDLPADASLNWWGDSTGPDFDQDMDGSTEYAGLGETVYGSVVFSPWLALDPDGDPSTPGVQVTAPMLIIVAPVGPEPTNGYLNAAIVGSNSAELRYADTIYVEHGAYDGSEPITQSVTIVSQPGSASHTTVTGAMSIGSGGVSIGLPLQGLRINGDITVADLVDAASVHINWCDLYGTATNNGDGTLDAQYNFWGTQEEAVIDARTIGEIDYAPYLPKNADDSYADITALIDAGLAGSLNGAVDQLWTLTRMGQDVGTYIEYQGVAGAGALHVTPSNGQVLATLLPGGGGGAVTQTGVEGAYVVGDKIAGQIQVTDPMTGLPVSDAIVTISLLNSESGVVYWGVATYDENSGGYVFEVDTSALAPGTYELIIQTDDGETQTLSVVVAEA
ncbi:MAG: right-handed parallel beta-helix repeat-containing protein [Thermotogota bacterium]